MGFGLMAFLNGHLKEQAVATMCKKLKRDTIDAAHLMAMLTMTVILFQVKRHHFSTGTRNKPKIDKKMVRDSVEHLCVYIIRSFGSKTEETEMVGIRNENG